MLKKAIRTAQSFFPGLPGAKNHACHFACQRLGQVQRHSGDADGVRLTNRGLEPEHVERALFIPSYRSFVHHGIATFSRSSLTAYFGPQTLYFHDPARLTISETLCVIDTLDSFALAPSFIEIDVEDFEYDVLLGARATLERSYGDAQVQPLLRGSGYVEVVARRGATRFEPGALRGLNMVLTTDRRLHAS